MERKFSYDLVAAAIELIKQAEIDHGSLGEQKVHAMLDAFDPGLKRQMLLDLIVGNGQRRVTIQYDPSVGDPRVVSAIKSIRYATGFGLKESKQVIDEARMHGQSTFTADVSLKDMAELEHELEKTGFKIKGR